MAKFYEHTSFVVRMRLPEDAEPMTVVDFHNWLNAALANDKGVIVHTYPAIGILVESDVTVKNTYYE